MKDHIVFTGLSTIESYLRQFEVAQRNFLLVAREDKHAHSKRWMRSKARQPRKLLALSA